MPVYLDIEQGTDEWMLARAGIPTASCFDKIITAGGKPSSQRQRYLYQLAGERLIGTKETSTYQNAAMLRGIELEPEAREFYEDMHFVDVEQTGIVYMNEDRQVSCSPDGLIGAIGGLEIKCPSLAVHIEYLLKGKLPGAYFQQVHGSIYVTGREWWDFMSYYPDCKPFILRVQRDDKFCKALEKELRQFNKELDEIVEQLS